MKTTSTKKATKKDCFLAMEKILMGNTADLDTEILLNFVNHELELLEKKNSKAKDTEATKVLHNKILEILGEGVMTSLEVFTAIVPLEKEITPQKVTYELNSLVKEGKVSKEVKSKEKKGKTAFYLS